MQNGNRTMETNCNKYKAQILDYLGGHLSPDKAVPIAAHIESCTDCQQMVNDMGVVPYLLLLDEQKMEDGVAKALQAYREANQVQHDAQRDTEPSPWEFMIRFRRLFEFRMAIPIGVLAAAAMVLLIVKLAYSPLDSNGPDTQLAQVPQAENVLSSPWMSLPTELEQAQTLFKAYTREESLINIQTLGGGVDIKDERIAKLEERVSFFSNLFAVMSLSENTEITSTAVVLDRERELLLSVYPTPEAVMLRPVEVKQQEEKYSGKKEHIRLNSNIACLARRIFQDDATGLALLYAPGINGLFPPQADAPFSLAEESLSGPAEAMAAVFVHPEESAAPVAPEEEEKASFFYDALLALEISPGNAARASISWPDGAPEGLPARTLLCTLDGAALTGILETTPEQNPTLILPEVIRTLLTNASPGIEEACANHQAWQDTHRDFIAALKPGAPPQEVTGITTAKTLLYPLPEQGYVLTIDLDVDGTPDLAIHSDHPGILISLPLSKKESGDGLIAELLSEIRSAIK